MVLPQYRGSSNVAIYAVYPCREFMPAKVNVFIEFLAELYGAEPYWDKPAQALAGRQLLDSSRRSAALSRGSAARKSRLAEVH